MPIKCKPNQYIEHEDYYEIIIDSPTYGEFRGKIDKDKYEEARKIIWCIKKCWNKKTNTEPKFYIATNYMPDTGKSELMHRWVINAPKSYIVDHINQDTLDNRKKNLRICTHSNNASNSKHYVNNTSGYKGVKWNKKVGKWMAYLMINRRHKTLGYFDNIEDAVACRKQGEEKYFGEFRPTN